MVTADFERKSSGFFASWIKFISDGFQGGRRHEKSENERNVTTDIEKAGALVLATAIVLGGGTYVYNQQNPASGVGDLCR